MGILKKIGMSSTDIRRLNGAIEALIHAITILSFVILGYWLIIKSGINIILGIIILVVSTYFIGSLIFFITRSVFKVIDKRLEKEIIEEINISLESIPKKEKKPSLVQKLKEKLHKEPITKEYSGNKMQVGGTPLDSEEIKVPIKE